MSFYRFFPVNTSIKCVGQMPYQIKSKIYMYTQIEWLSTSINGKKYSATKNKMSFLPVIITLIRVS